MPWRRHVFFVVTLAEHFTERLPVRHPRTPHSGIVVDDAQSVCIVELTERHHLDVVARDHHSPVFRVGIGRGF